MGRGRRCNGPAMSSASVPDRLNGRAARIDEGSARQQLPRACFVSVLDACEHGEWMPWVLVSVCVSVLATACFACLHLPPYPDSPTCRQRRGWTQRRRLRMSGPRQGPFDRFAELLDPN